MARTTALGLMILGVVSLAANAARMISPPAADDPPALKADIQMLRRVLPEDHLVGYLEHATRPGDADVVRQFYRMQYALAPRILVRTIDAAYVIVVADHDVPEDRRLDGFTPVIRTGDVRVFQRIPR